jgi:lysophospholipase L1-like esterase
MLTLRKIASTALIALLTLMVTAVAGELLLRIKNADGKNYTIEMWRYARELKQVSPDPELGHVHRPGQSARLQNIDISINSLGMRGPEPRTGTPHSVLLLGSSITLGWGVEESSSLRAELERRLGSDWQVLNGAIGNYTTSRYVALFEKTIRPAIKPDVVVVTYFVDDAKPSEVSSGNWLIRNSELAVTLYYVFAKIFHGTSDLGSLEQHYRRIYDKSSASHRAMVAAFDRLEKLSHDDRFRVVLSVVPDVHQLQNYPFLWIHDEMRALAAAKGWTFIDFLDVLKTFKGPELWTIPGDPHPNAVAHRLMAEHLAAALKP